MLKLKASKAFFPLLSQKDFSFSAVYLLKPVRSRNGHVFARAASHFLYSLLGTTCTRLQTNTLSTLAFEGVDHLVGGLLVASHHAVIDVHLRSLATLKAAKLNVVNLLPMSLINHRARQTFVLPLSPLGLSLG